MSQLSQLGWTTLMYVLSINFFDTELKIDLIRSQKSQDLQDDIWQAQNSSSARRIVLCHQSVELIVIFLNLLDMASYKKQGTRNNAKFSSGFQNSNTPNPWASNQLNLILPHLQFQPQSRRMGRRKWAAISWLAVGAFALSFRPCNFVGYSKAFNSSSACCKGSLF